jgi:hypothetical protein
VQRGRFTKWGQIGDTGMVYNMDMDMTGDTGMVCNMDMDMTGDTGIVIKNGLEKCDTGVVNQMRLECR